MTDIFSHFTVTIYDQIRDEVVSSTEMLNYFPSWHALTRDQKADMLRKAGTIVRLAGQEEK